MDRLRPKIEAGTMRGIPIRNHVVWDNKNLKAPFSFSENKASALGLFISHAPEKGSQKGGFDLGVRLLHGRSADVGRVIFEDRKGNKFRDIDIKGSGHVVAHRDEVSERIRLEAQKWKKEDADSISPKMLGLLQKGKAEEEAQKGEELADAGVRVSRALAILELEELPDEDGTLRPIGDYRNRPSDSASDLSKGYDPVLLLRAYGIKTRVWDLFLESTPIVPEEVLRREFDDAISFVSYETGTTLSPDEYLRWFADSLGRNIGRMHGAGYAHRCLHLGNITLDTRIVDLDTVRHKEKMPNEEDYASEIASDIQELSPDENGNPCAMFQGMSSTFHSLYKCSVSAAQMQEAFNTAYRQESQQNQKAPFEAG